MKIGTLSTIAGFALLLGAGTASAYDSEFIRETPSLQARGYSDTQPNFGSGADLNFMGSSGGSFERGRCVQAINENEPADVRAFCPQGKWLPAQ
jgi:hypothetical protein